MSRQRREEQLKKYNEYLQNLFEALKTKTIKPELLAEAWIKAYQNDSQDAMLLMISFVLTSCGALLPPSESQPLIQNKAKFFKVIQANCKDIESFPLQNLIRYKVKNFEVFFSKIVEFSEENLNIIQHIIEWLYGFSTLTFRNYRLFSTIALISILSSLISLKSTIKRKNENISSIQARSQRNTRSQQLSQESHFLVTTLKTIEKIIEELFNNFLLFRYKDVMYEVRLACVNGMEKFLNTEYCEKIVSVVQEMTYDKKNEIRFRVLKTIKKSDYLIEILRQRILEMCYDIDDKCCDVAIQICKSLINLLSKNDINGICTLAWSENEIVRNSALGFIVETQFEGKLPTGTSESIGLGLEQGNLLSIEKALLSLVSYFKQNAEKIEHSYIFVKGLWAKTSAIRSVDVICDLLLRGTFKSSSVMLPESDATILASFLASICNFLSSEQKDKSKIIKVSTTIMAKLSQVFVAYKKDSNTLKELINIPLFIDLNCLASRDLQNPFIALLDIIKTIFLQSPMADIVNTAATVLNKFAEELHPMKKEAKAELVKVIDDITKSTPENFLLQISSLIKFKGLNLDLPENFMTKAIRKLPKSPEPVLNYLLYNHMWNFKKYIDSTNEDNEYIRIRDQTLMCFCSVINDKKYEASQVLAYKNLCETLIIISSDKIMNFGKGYYEIPQKIWEVLENFIVFSYLPNDQDENSEVADDICISGSRAIINCQDLIFSQLSSSFLAFFGRSNLKVISIVVKQFLSQMKIKEDNHEWAFKNDKLFFSIYFQALLKVLCKGSAENIRDMKELCKKLVAFLPSECKSKNSDKFMKFIQEIVDFSFVDPANFGLIETVMLFVSKGVMSAEKIKEVYDHVKYYAKNFVKKDLLNQVLAYLRKLLGDESDDEKNERSSKERSDRASPVSDSTENKTPASSFKKPKIYKVTPSNIRPRMPRKSKEKSLSSLKKNLKRKSSDIGNNKLETSGERQKKKIQKKKLK